MNPSRFRYVLLTAALLGGCTPFGLWIYDEPTVEFQDVLIDASTAADALPPYVIVGVANRNDYDLSLRGMDLVFRVDGRDIGTAIVDTVVTLRSRMVQPVRVKVPPADQQARVRLHALASGTHSYVVEGRARIETPLGERRIGFSEEIRGTVAATAAPAP